MVYRYRYEAEDRSVILTARDTIQIITALRYWGRAAETCQDHPKDHPLCHGRFTEHSPMTLDEIEALIGRLDGTWKSRKFRPWNPWKHL